MSLNIIDLFVGCGGLSDGFLQTKRFKTLSAIDWDIDAINTFKKRLKKKWNYKKTNNIVVNDIQKINEILDDDNKDGLSYYTKGKKVDGIIGGPPCQAYSIAGRVRDKNGMRDDYRNYLFESYIEILKFYKPKFFVFENVQGMLNAKPGGELITERISKKFKEAGYDIIDNFKDALFDMSYYSIPQVRKRVIIFGVLKSKESLNDVKKFYNEIKKYKKRYQTIVNDYLVDLPKFIPNSNGEKKISHKVIDNNSMLNHSPRYHNKRDIKIFNVLTKDIETGVNRYNSTKSLIELYKEFTGKESKFHKYNVIRYDRPSNTIPAHLYKDGLRHIHPDSEQSRSLTVREAARIQTFNDDFEFLGSIGSQYKMIGNAVPPIFSKLIAKVILKVLY